MSNPILFVDPPVQQLPKKNKVITIYKQELFEDLDAETRRFTMMRPDAPGYQSDITASDMVIQETPYSFSKERTVTIYKQALFEDLDAETRKFSEMRPAEPSHASEINPTAMIQNTPYTFVKDRTVTIIKQKLYEDIDTESYKFMEGNTDAPSQKSNAVSSDTAERLDGHIIARLAEISDARLRKRLNQYLKNNSVVATADNTMILDAAFVYNLTLSTEFNDSMMDALAKHMHHYIVWSVLFDWYGASIGSEQAKWFQLNIKESEDAIIKLIASIDGHLAVRHLEARDAQLRRRMMRYIKNATTVASVDDSMKLDSSFVYTFILSTEFNDSMMDALGKYIHRYLVIGALYDWYGASLGSEQAKWFANEILANENAIANLATRIDGRLAIRHLNYRDAKLRRKIRFALVDNVPVETGNDHLVLNDSYVYNLELFGEFKDAMVQPLTEHIHRYLLWGALYDWYGSSLGDRQAAFYEGELDELESTIHDMLIGPAVGKRPLQPFGPAYEIPV